jgi:hypothetical protein
MTTKRLGFRTLPLLGFTILGTGCAALLGLDQFSEGSTTSTSASSGSGGAGGVGGMTDTSGTGGTPVCQPDTQMACESGLPGACAAGTQTCKPDGTGYTICVPTVAPSSAAEDCKKIGDEDCDGVACSDAVWSFLAGDANDELPKAMTVDAAGNVFVTGVFSGTLKFLDKINQTSVVLNTGGGRDTFLAKFSAKGDVIWAKSFGDAMDSPGASAVAVDTAGAVYIAGGFSGTVNYGSGMLTASGSADAFVAKFDAAGTPQWSKRFGAASGNFSNYAVAMSVDVNGDVVVGGVMSGTVTFGVTMFSATAGFDVFVTKLAGAMGTVVWAKRFKENVGSLYNNQFLDCLTTDSTGNIFLAGRFEADILFGGTALPALVDAAGSPTDSNLFYDAFVAKLDTKGTASWARSIATANIDEATGIAVDGSGNVLVTGQVGGGSIDFGGGLVSGPGKPYNGFLAKYTNVGGYVNAKILPVNRGVSLDADGADNIYLTGTLAESGDLGGGALPFVGIRDIFLAKFDASFGHLWSKSFGDAKDQAPTATRYDKATKTVLLSGTVSGSIDFGTGSLTGMSTTSSDMALAKFQP